LEKKKIAEIIASIFVAVIFLSSYASFGGKIIHTNVTTTAQIPPTFKATASGTATITSFSPTINITIGCQNVTDVSGKITGFVDAQNKSVVEISYSPRASQILVTAGTAGSYSLYNSIVQAIGSDANCTTFAGSAQVMLPATMNFRSSLITAGGASAEIPGLLRTSSQSILFSGKMSNTINVLVDAILTYNGTIYRDNIIVRQA
jgi:hypothetical protein